MTIKGLLLFTFFVILVGSLLLVGCGGQAQTSATTAPAASTPATKAPTTALAATSSAAATPQKGGTLRLGWPTLSVNKLGYPPTTTSPEFRLCLEGFFNFDEHLNLVPYLATDWEVGADGKYITLTLRKGVKFHDGSDFNAAVAKWNLDNYRSSTKPELKNVSSVDIVDDYNIRLNLSSYDCLLSLVNLAKWWQPC